MRKKRMSVSMIILVVILIAGLSLLLYPSVSNYWNSFHMTTKIAEYEESIALLDTSEYERICKEAKEYNERLAREQSFEPFDAEKQIEYNSQLNMAGGMMGYIEIPCIRVSLPIYHGTDEGVLQIGLGHLEWSSLPIGGINTHCVLSGHRGLPSARLLTDLDRLIIGDHFMLSVFGETLTYEVDQIQIVFPEELSTLKIEDGKDYCTLVTCTPYGVNTHRLLVRGHRVDNQELMDVKVEAEKINPLIVALFVAGPVLVILIIILFIVTGNKKRSTINDFRVGGNNETNE